MGFRTVNFAHLARFNSSTSSDFLDKYESFVDEKIRKKNSEPSHRTFAPSSFRCDRRSWFRIRGVQPDSVKTVDVTLNFTAEIGTACHRIIQTNLKECLGSDWIEVSSYLKTHPIPWKYNLEPSEDSLETRVEIIDIPVRFSVDGIIRLNGEYYLLEIKTSEFSSWNDLTDPKSEHRDQILCYCALLGLKKAIVLYQDRQYGGFKCYEVSFTNDELDSVITRFYHVLDMVDKNLAPDGLPVGDKWCSPSMCLYYKRCQEYGRF